MAGILQGTVVVVEDQAEASQIHNKGYYGVPQSGGSLKLDIMEAIYLVESGRLEVEGEGRKWTAAGLLQLAHKVSEGFEIRYLGYRELRQRGYLVKLGQPPLDFRVFPRGGSPNKSPKQVVGGCHIRTLCLRPGRTSGESRQDHRCQEEAPACGCGRGERRNILRGQTGSPQGATRGD